MHPSGDILDVFRTDSGNLFDIDSLADLIDDWEESPLNRPGAIGQPFVPDVDVKTVINTNGGGSNSSSGRHSSGLSTSVAAGPDAMSAPIKCDGSTADVFHRSSLGSLSAVATAGGAESADNLTMGEDGQPSRKKRTRNATQMEHNRVAQQKYRERKKLENRDLQQAVDMLTAELAAMKALEMRAATLEHAHRALGAQLAGSEAELAALRVEVAEKNATISRQVDQLAGQSETIASQQRVILDQHAKLRMQEEIIANLKERLRVNIEDAYNSAHQLVNPDPASVCAKMHAAVRTALESAKDMEGLQDTLQVLSKLPDSMVVEICKNILRTCRDLWPDLAARFDARFPQFAACAARASAGSCATAVGTLG